MNSKNEAKGLNTLNRNCGTTADELMKATGRSRTYASVRVRLFSVQTSVRRTALDRPLAAIFASTVIGGLASAPRCHLELTELCMPLKRRHGVDVVAPQALYEQNDAVGTAGGRTDKSELLS